MRDVTGGAPVPSAYQNVLGERVNVALYAARGREDALVRVRRELAHLFAPEVAALARAMTGRPAARRREATIERLVDYLLVAKCQRLGVLVRGHAGLFARGVLVGTVVQTHRRGDPRAVLADLAEPISHTYDQPITRMALIDVTPYHPEHSS